MALDSGDIRVGGDTHVWLAPVATAFPDWGEDPADPWVDLGFTTTDGVTFNFGREINEIYAMQSAEPVRTINTRLPKTIAFNLMQAGRDQILLALGGGSWALEATETDVYRYEPPSVGEIDERALLIEMADGDAHYRWHFKRAQNREGIEFSYQREDAATFSITMAVLAPTDASVPFYLTSDDPSVGA
jgi:hypothetical protein